MGNFTLLQSGLAYPRRLDKQSGIGESDIRNGDDQNTMHNKKEEVVKNGKKLTNINPKYVNLEKSLNIKLKFDKCGNLLTMMLFLHILFILVKLILKKMNISKFLFALVLSA